MQGGGAEWRIKEKKKKPAPFVRLPTFLDERLNVKSPRKKERKEEKEEGNGALLISTSDTARRFRRLKAEIEPSAASALADSVSVGPHARLRGVGTRLSSPPFPSSFPSWPPPPASRLIGSSTWPASVSLSASHLLGY